jgi:scyllo-inositol 2-dehydrogenase (NADP+)
VPDPLINVGLVGFGFAGRTFHAPVISEVRGLHLNAILQRHGDDASQAYPDARVVRSLPEMLAVDSISLIVVATPNDSHFSIAKECLLAGRDVVIDKPFAPTYAEAAELARLAQSHGRVLSVYQNRRWDGDFKTLQKLIASGELGRVVTYESHFDRFRPARRPGAWREQAGPGAGVLFDLGPHLIDQALVLFGTPDAVSADVRLERHGADADDAFDITLVYPGLRAYLRATMLASRPGPHFVVHGTRGSYIKFGLDPQEDALKRGERPGGSKESSNWGREPDEAWGALTFGAVGSLNERGIPVQAAEERRVPTEPGDYRGYYENVRDAILGKAELAVTPTAALRVMRVIELARQSSRERRVVDFVEP